jgi:hypothetical protein
MNTLETRVLELIGESISSPDVFTDDSTGMAQVRDSINDAIEEICVLTGSYRKVHHIPLESSKFFYQLDPTPEAFAWPVSVWLVDQKRRLSQKDFIWLVNYNPRFLYASGTPEFYCPIGFNKICVYPAPGSDADMLEIDCVAIPDRYTLDTDRIKLRNSFQWAAVNYAVGEYWASRGDGKSAIRSHMKYLEYLGIQELYPEAYDRVWQFQTVKSDK